MIEKGRRGKGRREKGRRGEWEKGRRGEWEKRETWDYLYRRSLSSPSPLSNSFQFHVIRVNPR